MLNKIKEILDKDLVVNRHSDFQIEKFIVGKELSPSAQAWQCVRELKTRYESLGNLEMEIENVLDDIEIKRIEIEEEKEKNTRKTPFLVRKLERSLKNLEINHNKLQYSEYNVNTFVVVHYLP
jgi:FtsZ-binding cell division protein ZapB